MGVCSWKVVLTRGLVYKLGLCLVIFSVHPTHHLTILHLQLPSSGHSRWSNPCETPKVGAGINLPVCGACFRYLVIVMKSCLLQRWCIMTAMDHGWEKM